MRVRVYAERVGLRAATAAFLLRVSAWLGFSTAPSSAAALTLDSPTVERAREMNGGQLQPQPVTQTRWYLTDLESAERMADGGSIGTAARLMNSARKDGILAGVLSTRTGGLVRLPKRFRGDPDIIAALEIGHDETRSVFEEMFPATELALLAADGILCGVGVGELVTVEGRDYPVFVRLDPQFLEFRWSENRWYYRSVAGPIQITPGDGRWMLHTPGGRQAPWQNALWKCIGRAFIRKEHANLHKDNWEAKLANPARVAVSPAGAGEEQAQSWWRAVMAWGVNTVFGLRPGYDVKLIESNGRGFDSFVKTIADQNNEMIIAVAGQTVTTDGGAGFANADIHKSIRADLIKETADGLAYTLNTQGLPVFIATRFGPDALDVGCVMEWDVTPPKDRTSEAQALVSVAQAVTQLTDAFAAHGKKLDVDALAVRFGVPLAGDLEKVVSPKKLDLAPTDIAKVVKAVEARSAQGLPPFGDDRDELTVSQLGDVAAAEAKAEAAPAPVQLKEAA